MDTPQSPPTVQAELVDPVKEDIAKNKDIAAFSYLWIASVIIYLLKRSSPFVRFHSKQAMVLFALSIVVLFIPFISRILALGVLLLMIYGFVTAAQGKYADVPVVGPLSRGEINLRQAWRQLLDGIVYLVHKFKKSTDTSKSDDSSNANPPTI